MAESSESTQEQQGGNGSDIGKTALRAAAIAAASGATAIAAKRAFSDRQGSASGSSGKENGDSSGGGESVVGGMVGSGWNAARDSIVPFVEEAANAAGKYLAQSGPDFVRETVVPSFIEGFMSAQKSAVTD
jgi:hypothetical protein